MPRHFARYFQEEARRDKLRREAVMGANKRKQDQPLPEYVPVPAQIVMVTKKESSLRSLLKTLTWNLTDWSATVIIAFLFTRDVRQALAIGVVQQLWEASLYFFHERLWAKVKKV